MHACCEEMRDLVLEPRDRAVQVEVSEEGEVWLGLTNHTLSLLSFCMFCGSGAKIPHSAASSGRCAKIVPAICTDDETRKV